MRVFAVSDIHIDYEVNARWVVGLSWADYQDDALILAGDVTDTLPLLGWCLETLARRFRKVLFVPGNHDLWVMRERGGTSSLSSLEKFQQVAAVTESSGASMQPFRDAGVSIIPLLGWYDYSFGEPSPELRSVWMDYRACRWPTGFREEAITAYFAALNSKHLSAAAGTVITFSHFLPRIDLMPNVIPPRMRLLYPVLGTTRLEQQLRQLGPSVHVYGHSHVNRNVNIDGVSYVNNAFGYPSESHIAAKSLLCVHE
jgi:predicted phosphodiesterase